MHRYPTRPLLGLTAGLLLSVALTTPAAAQAVAPPNLAGTWRLVDRDDPADKLRDPPPPDSGPPGAGERPPVARPGGGRGSRGHPVSEEERERMRQTREAMRRLMRSAAAYRIEQTADSLRFLPLRVGDPLATVALDGRKSTVGDGAERLELRARWDGAALRLDRKFANGLRMSERYALSMDASHLVVDVRLEGGDRVGPVEFRRLYQRAQPAAESPGS